LISQRGQTAEAGSGMFLAGFRAADRVALTVVGEKIERREEGDMEKCARRRHFASCRMYGRRLGRWFKTGRLAGKDLKKPNQPV